VGNYSARDALAKEVNEISRTTRR